MTELVSNVEQLALISPNADRDVEFVYCDSAASVDAALRILANAPFVYIDCEGEDLGTVDGSLSVLSIGVLTDEEYLVKVIGAPECGTDTLQGGCLRIFLVDLWVLLPEEKQPILSFLETSNAVKILWDGRMDACALYNYHTTRMRPTLDLQLIDIRSRTLRGEADDRRLRRLSRKTFPLSEVKKMQLVGVHTLSSLDRALKEHDVTSVPLKDRKSFNTLCALSVY